MAFIEFETEDAYNEAVNAKVNEAVEAAINDKNQGWLPDRLKKTHDKAVEETKALYADYDQLKEESTGFETERASWATSKADYEKQIADLTTAAGNHGLELARLTAAMEYGLSADDAKRLIGNTPDEIKADAKTFAEAHPKRNGYFAPKPEGGDEISGVEKYLKNKDSKTYK